MENKISFGNFKIVLPPGWSITQSSRTSSFDLSAVVATSTEGLGALYVSRTITPQTMNAEALLRSWSTERDLHRPLDHMTVQKNSLTIASASYQVSNDYIQVWCVCNGKDAFFMHYVCPWVAREDERSSREALFDCVF